MRNRAVPPCEGAQGRCTRNLDGTLGGFVADTAEVETKSIFGIFQKRNRFHLGQYAQVCERAHVSGNVRIGESARVFGDAQVFGTAHVFGHARVFGNAQVFGDAHISGNAHIFENAQVSEYAAVYGETSVFGNAQVSGAAQISDNACVFERACVSEYSQVCGRVHVFGDAQVYGRAKLSRFAWIFGNARIWGDAQISGQARVSGDSRVFGDAQVFGDAMVSGATYISGQEWISGNAPNNDWLSLGPNLPGLSLPEMISDEERPEAITYPYSKSEAEIYRAYLDRRHNYREFFEQGITILDERIDVTKIDFDAFDAFEPGYEIVSETLAAALTSVFGKQIPLHSMIVQSELQKNSKALDIIASCVENEYLYFRHAFPKEFISSHFLEPKVQRYLDFIRETLLNRIRRLDASAEALIYEIPYDDLNTRARQGKTTTYRVQYYKNKNINLNNGICIHDMIDQAHRRSSVLFMQMMDAIRTDDEQKFLSSMLSLATSFHPSRITARNGFMEAFTFLFVVKRFPDPFVRQRYLHFTLNCGKIY